MFSFLSYIRISVIISEKKIASTENMFILNDECIQTCVKVKDNQYDSKEQLFNEGRIIK